MNFTVISYYEQLEEDIAYYLLKTNTSSLIREPLAQRNPSFTQDPVHLTGLEKDKVFWKGLTKEQILGFIDLYKDDLTFFNYSAEKYFEHLNLTHLLY